MSKIPSPEELRRNNQPAQTERLIQWAEQAGFILRNNGSSHYRLTHSVHPDIYFNLIGDSKCPGMKRVLAKALTKLQDRVDEMVDLQKKFEIAAKSKLSAINDRLPHYIHAEYNAEKGTIVLRDNNLPQLGLTLKAGEEKIIDNKVRQLEGMKREAYILLNRCKMAYDIDLGNFKNGNFEGIVSHAVYQMPETQIRHYQSGDDPQRLFTALHTYIAQVQEKDLEHQIRLESVFENPCVSNKLVVFNARRGERSLILVCDTPGQSGLKQVFTSHSNKRADTADIFGGRMAEAELERMETMITRFSAPRGNDRSLAA